MTAADAPSTGRGERRAVAGVLAVALGHALVVAGRYHVGSFDDDASYVLSARAIAAGHGLASRMAGGYPLVGVYPPGYPALLSPLAAIGRSFVPLRAASLAMFVAVFPLAWLYLRRLGLPPAVRVAALALLALNPVLATYATMVMPETTFVVVLLGLLLAAQRWEKEPRVATWPGLATIAAAAGLLWLKEAGLGLVIGVALWLLLRRGWRFAAAALGGPLVLIAPLLVVRALVGANLIGSRYSSDLGGAFHGGLVSRMTHLVPHAVRAWVGEAIPRTIVPTNLGLLPSTGAVGRVLAVLTWTAFPLVAVGSVVCWRRYHDAAGPAVAVYIAETLIYPFTNERRAVLIVPVLVAWYVVGAAALFAFLRAAAGRVGWRPAGWLAAAVPVVAIALVVTSMAAQVTRDYLFFEGADSSRPDGAPYMAFLHHAGSPADVVESDFLWTAALFSEHRSAGGAYLARCQPAAFARAVNQDRAGFVLTAALNGGGAVDDSCILATAASSPAAVRLYRSARDLASVFELVGAGTGHPGLQDLTGRAAVSAFSSGTTVPVAALGEFPQAPGDPAGAAPTATSDGAPVTLTWTWPAPVAVSQLSVAGAHSLPVSATAAVTVEVSGGGSSWRTVAGAPGPVSPESATPFVVVALAPPAMVSAVRVTITPRGPATVVVHDLHALGPTG